MKPYRFYKEELDHWYIDLPNVDKMNCEMVSGADEMLDYIAGDETEIHLVLSTEPFKGPLGQANLLEFDTFGKVEYEGGAYYRADKYGDDDIDMIIWLCPVTVEIFGEYPDKIYYLKYTN